MVFITLAGNMRLENKVQHTRVRRHPFAKIRSLRLVGQETIVGLVNNKGAEANRMDQPSSFSCVTRAVDQREGADDYEI